MITIKIWKEEFMMENKLIAHSIDKTVEKAIEFIQQKNFKIFDDIDQQKEAIDVGLKIPQTRLIIFGNPKVGTLLMQENDEITFELPIKVLFIQKGQQTKMIYKDPYDFAGYDHLKDQGKEIIQKMHGMYLEMEQTLR